MQWGPVAMPEPDYAGGEGPGLWWFLVGLVIVAILFLLLKSCT